MKHQVTIRLLMLVLLSTLTSCDDNKPSNASLSTTKRVSVITPMTHPSLDETVDGFEAGLREAGFTSDKVTITYHNASGDFGNIASLVKLSLEEKPDVIFVLTTPAATTAIQITNLARVPLVYAAVTDPVAAKIVTSMERSDTYATGVSDRYPVEEQVAIFNSILPLMKTAAILFNPDEENSRILVAATAEALKKRDIEAKEYQARTSDAIAPQAKLALSETDCIIINGDNLATNNLDVVINLCARERKPLFVGDPESVRRGAVATVGPSYFDIGKAAGQKAAKVLGGTDVREIPSEYPTAFDYIVNMEAAEKMGVSVPQNFWVHRSLWESRAASAVER